MNKFTIFFLTILTSGMFPVWGSKVGESIYKANEYLKKSPATNELTISYNEFLEEKVKTIIESIQTSTVLGSMFSAKKVDEQEEFFKEESKKLAEEKAVWHQIMKSTLSPPKPTTLFSKTFNL